VPPDFSSFRWLYDLAAYQDEANYGDNHFMTNYGSCTVCHDVHKTTLETVPNKVEGAIQKKCSDCHRPGSSYTPEGGMAGFHDAMSNPDAPSTLATADTCLNAEGADQTTCEANGGEWHVAGDSGVNANACVTCHMPGGDHEWFVKVDPAYLPMRVTEYTSVTGITETQCKAKPYYDSWSTSSGGRCRYYNMDPADIGPQLGVDEVCLQCHNGSDPTVKEFTNMKALFSGISGNYHEMAREFTASTTAECTACHADKKDSFAQTGHANTARLVPPDFNITGPGGATLECGHDGFYNVVDGKCYTELGGAGDVLYGGLTVLFFHHSWFEPVDEDGTLVSGARPIVSGNSFNCAPCHTTGFRGDNTGPITADSLGITVGSNSSYLVTPIDVSSGASWDEFGVQCANCHGKNTEADTHTASMPTTAPETNALCGKCHLQKHHTVSFLNGPHGGFTLELPAGTYATLDQIGDPANYDPDNHFSSRRNGCAGCHNVHATTIEAAGGGDAAFNNQCGINCHTSKASTPMLHPKQAGSPFDTTMYKSACVVCHMPGNYRTDHLFEINTDADYTRPSSSTATIPGAGRVLLDVDDACGQCHGGSSTATKNGAPYMTKPQLAMYAAGIHNGVNTAMPVPPTPSIAGGAVSIDASWTATATDTSTPGSSALQSVSMAWGDGTVTTQDAGTTFTHTYMKAGSYTVTQTAKGNDGGSASAQYFVEVANPTFSGTVRMMNGTTPIGGAMVWLKRTSNGKTNTYITASKADGSFSYYNIGPGTYTAIYATKSGYIFSCAAPAGCDPNVPANLNIQSTNK
jgi:hypothetical protein